MENEFNLAIKAKQALNEDKWEIVVQDLTRMLPLQSFVIYESETGDEIRRIKEKLHGALGEDEELYFLIEQNPKYDNETFKLEVRRLQDYGTDSLDTGLLGVRDAAQVLVNNNYSPGRPLDGGYSKYKFIPKAEGLPIAVFDPSKRRINFWYTNLKGREENIPLLRKIREEIAA